MPSSGDTPHHHTRTSFDPGQAVLSMDTILKMDKACLQKWLQELRSESRATKKGVAKGRVF